MKLNDVHNVRKINKKNIQKIKFFNKNIIKCKIKKDSMFKENYNNVRYVWVFEIIFFNYFNIFVRKGKTISYSNFNCSFLSFYNFLKASVVLINHSKLQ